MANQPILGVRSRSMPVPPAAPPGALREETVQDLVDFFRLLADRSRLRIVLTLAQDGEQNVSRLCARLGQSQPAVSHHLIRMRRCGLLSCRREGKHNFYSLAAGRLTQLLRPLLSDPAHNGKQIHLGEIIVSLRASEGKA